ncbi:diguanylate cyclase domain-containing protein [Vogesella sp. GCM10023246]|uniref:Sensor domain-containing diguanylate cyclase n=1 Tax=Vogesella oryzagri TaxID=3160864 RepID=A0ABV1M1Y2_9NEIS
MAHPTLPTDAQALQHELASLRQELAAARLLIATQQEKLNAALDGTGLCLWQGQPPTGELQVFNLQDFKPGDMASHFEAWYAKVHPDDRDRVVNHYFAHLLGETDSYEAEYRTIGLDGRITWLWDRGRVIERDADGKALRIMGAHADITQRKENELALQHMAQHDALTGLLNRSAFYQRLNHAIERTNRNGGNLAVLFVDLDLFKQVNDQHGHVIGDRLLQQVARQLLQVVRDGDVVARLGGDEFIIYLQGETGPPPVEEVGQRLLDLLNREQLLDDLHIDLGASIGTSIYPHDGNNAEALVQHADAAMYQAKADGRRRVRHYQHSPLRQQA